MPKNPSETLYAFTFNKSKAKQSVFTMAIKANNHKSWQIEPKEIRKL